MIKANAYQEYNSAFLFPFRASKRAARNCKLLKYLLCQEICVLNAALFLYQELDIQEIKFLTINSACCKTPGETVDSTRQTSCGQKIWNKK